MLLSSIPARDGIIFITYFDASYHILVIPYSLRRKAFTYTIPNYVLITLLIGVLYINSEQRKTSVLLELHLSATAGLIR